VKLEKDFDGNCAAGGYRQPQQPLEIASTRLSSNTTQRPPYPDKTPSSLAACHSKEVADNVGCSLHQTFL
jgi:hypothetical protein